MFQTLEIGSSLQIYEKDQYFLIETNYECFSKTHFRKIM